MSEGLPNNEYITKPDGAVWRQFYLDNGVAVVTSAGEEAIFFEGMKILSTLRQYKRDVIARREGDLAIRREMLAAGGNATFYRVKGTDIGIKETHSTHSAFYALERMDKLSDVVESGNVPRWIDLPRHYGYVMSKNDRNQYLLMQCIDGGVTVEDVLSGGRNPAIEKLVSEQFGYINDDMKNEIKSIFAKAKEVLDAALVEEGIEPKELLPDWHEGNVLIEPLRTPIAGKRYKLWIIDQ